MDTINKKRKRAIQKEKRDAGDSEVINVISASSVWQKNTQEIKEGRQRRG